MCIEVDYSGRGTTHSVLKWIAVGVALHVALHPQVFCEDEAVFNPLTILLLNRIRFAKIYQVKKPCVKLSI